MKTVITGGAGFIGVNLASLLLERGHDVTILDNLSAQIHGEMPHVILPTGATFLRVDIRNIGEQKELFDTADVIYHLAAETGTGQSMYEIEKYSAVNELGTAKLLQVLTLCSRRPRKLILASSRSVYGEGAYIEEATGQLVQPDPRHPDRLADGLWNPVTKEGVENIRPVATPETMGFSVGSIYAATKAAQELLMKAAAPGLGATANVFRFQNVYGEGQSLQNPYTGIISIFFNRARQGLGISLFEDGLASRDFIHVEDIVRPLADAIDTDLPNGLTVNLGSGRPTTVQELAEQLVSIGGYTVPIQVSGQYRVGDIRHCWADLSVAKKYLGFEPAVSLPEGLERFADWAKYQPEYHDQSEKAMLELKEKGLTK